VTLYYQSRFFKIRLFLLVEKAMVMKKKKKNIMSPAKKKSAAKKKKTAQSTAAKKKGTKASKKKATHKKVSPSKKAATSKKTKTSVKKKVAAPKKPPAKKKVARKPASKTAKKVIQKPSKKTTKRSASKNAATSHAVAEANPVVKRAKSRIKPATLATLREILLQKRAVLEGDVSSLKEGAFRPSSPRVSTDHMADLGTDSYDQNFNLGLVEFSGLTLTEINEAINRIDEGSFGICEECGCAIPKARIEAIPYTRCCISCQTLREHF